MATGSTEVDRLIEEGLILYGQGNLDGALLVWEQALVADPENAQASSYVDYVRMNYELLTSDLGDEDGGPFGIAADGEPEYQIEILPGEAPVLAPAPLHMDPLDEGWFLGDDGAKQGGPDPLGEASDGSLTLELEAEEPPEPSTSREPTVSDLGFEHETQGYGNIDSRDLDASAHGEFSPEATPGFGSQVTDVRRRDLGFVKPTAPPRPAIDLELPLPLRNRPPTAEPPELKMTLRTPQHGDEVETAEVSPLEPNRPGSEPSSFEQSYAALDFEPPTSMHPVLTVEDDDLILSLPSPRPLHVTRDLPVNIVPPHQKAALDAIELDVPIDPPALSSAPTSELPPSITLSATQTQDFGDKPTREVERPANLRQTDPLVSAPTRELGLRAGAMDSGRTPTEDQPTLTSARALAVVEMDEEGTRGDIMLAFDPIDARTALILEEIDVNAPANESREDQTRRRITTLCDMAQVWTTGDEPDKAVAAIDLALSEDPNSALAQKLLHRNRDTIMSVFQSFLGDLQRQPSLARPLHELGSAPISPRAAFLLSRVDGSLTLDEILDVSGMPRLEAYRYLCQLFLRGILR